MGWGGATRPSYNMSTGSTLRWDNKESHNRDKFNSDIDRIIAFIQKETTLKIVSEMRNSKELIANLKLEKDKK